MSNQNPNAIGKLEGKEREDAFKRIWQASHADHKGKLADGSLSVMGWAKYGVGRLVTASSISNEELADRLMSLGSNKHDH